MRWIHHFQLFLFDLDGLLIDSEKLYYQAFMTMMRARGISVDWDFNIYCEKAHTKSKGLRDQTYTLFPSLLEQEPEWEVIEQEIKLHYLQLIKEKQLNLMPGVLDLLTALKAHNIKRAVVTNTKPDIVAYIQEQFPILQTIPHWITRDQYQLAKPHPESYFKAIQLLSAQGDRIIGFEDSVRGMQALQKTQALAVMVCDPKRALDQVVHFPSFKDIPEDWY